MKFQYSQFNFVKTIVFGTETENLRNFLNHQKSNLPILLILLTLTHL